MTTGEAPRRLSHTEAAYLTLKQQILDNVLPPGSLRMETELAAELGISRTPVREALIRLVNDGLIQVRPRHGMLVLPVSLNDVRDIYELIAELEPLAAKRLAESGLATDQLGAMERAVDAMEAALERDDLKAWSVADEDFHRLLLTYCGNRRLVTVLNTVQDQAHRVQILTLRRRPKPIQSTRDHRDVLEAIRARDPARAHQVHREHRLRINAMNLALLEELGLGAGPI